MCEVILGASALFEHHAMRHVRTGHLFPAGGHGRDGGAAGELGAHRSEPGGVTGEGRSSLLGGKSTDSGGGGAHGEHDDSSRCFGAERALVRQCCTTVLHYLRYEKAWNRRVRMRCDVDVRLRE